MKKRILLAFVPFLLMLTASSTRASSLGLDFTFYGQSLNFLNLKTHSSFMLGSNAVEVGPVVWADGVLPDNYELIVGGGVKVGSVNFIELDAGIDQKHSGTRTGRGVAGAVVFGSKIYGNFRVIVPVIARYMHRTLPKRWTVDFVPYIGFEFRP